MTIFLFEFSMSDVSSILIWWLTIGVLGAIAYPLTARLFHRFADRGYIFSKIIGLVLSSYIMWLSASLHIFSFDRLSIIIILLGLLLITLWFRTYNLQPTTYNYLPWRWIIFEEVLFLVALSFWSYVRATEPSINGLEKFMDYGFMNSILRSQYFPPLDMWLAKSPDYPGGHFINYYYFGHYYAAFLTKLSGLEPAVTYNLMLATLFAWTFTLSFSLGMNAWHLFRAASIKHQAAGKNAQRPDFQPPRPKDDRPLAETSNLQLLLVGLLTAFLITCAGNLHTIYIFTEMYPNHEEPIPFWKLAWGWHPDRYWYPDATRFIANTIHEFPIYSFVVADLHGHVSDIPFVFLTVAVLLSLLHHSSIGNLGDRANRAGGLPGFFSDFEKRTAVPLPYVAFLGLLLAVMYMTNAWDGLIYMVLAGLAILACVFRAQSRFGLWAIGTKTAGVSLVLVFTFILCSLPFSRNFQPFVSGVGVLCPPNALFEGPTPPASSNGEAPADANVRTLGPLLFEKDHCQRSPLYMMATLWGFFFFNAAALILFIILPKLYSLTREHHANHAASHAKTSEPVLHRSGFFQTLTRLICELPATDICMLILIFVSTLLIIFPEFFYMKDIYPTHYRANTMFKLGYQAFMLMGLVSMYTVFRIKSAPITGRLLGGKRIYLILFLLLFYLVASYPYFAIRSYYDSLRTYRGLYGLNWLQDRYPDDYQAILWLNKNVGCSAASAGPDCTNQPVIVEANGDSYTDYDRVSANTGLPTIVGWPVHEWLWRGSYDEAGRRIPEIETVYISKDMEKTQEILKKYHAEYIFLGQLEREKYKELDEEKLDQLGSVVFQSGDTKVYRLHRM